MKVLLVQGQAKCARRARILSRRASIAQNRAVNAVVEARSTAVCDGANPVVADVLVGVQNEGVALAGNWIYLNSEYFWE